MSPSHLLAWSQYGCHGQRINYAASLPSLMDSSLNELIPLLDLSTSLDANLNRSLVMTVLPGVMCVGGVLFLHLSIMGAIILYYSSLAASLEDAMWPLIRHMYWIC